MEMVSATVAFDYVMISIDCIHPPGSIETGKKFKTAGMDLLDLLYGTVFPQFVPVSQFQTGESPAIVILQSRQVEVLVV